MHKHQVIYRSIENTCKQPVIMRARYFAKYDFYVKGYAHDYIIEGETASEKRQAGDILILNNTHLSDEEMITYYPPPREIAYCAEFVDNDLTPEYLYRTYRHPNSGMVMMNSEVVDDLRRQGINIAFELKSYYDAYIPSLAYSPCYTEVIREPPVNYEHYAPISWFVIHRLGTWVEYKANRNAETGFHALSFDGEDFEGVSFHDAGGTENHHISDLPKPAFGD